MKLRSLTTAPALAGMRVLVRVDWNVPLEGGVEPEASLKIERSLETIQWLSKKKAIVILLTHLGRPEGHDKKYSTERLVKLMKHHYGLECQFQPESVSVTGDRKSLLERLEQAPHGSVHLLENVRFEVGEEKNTVALNKAYASLGQLFVNDAFASSHRGHASVIGIASQLPAYAGFSLQAEVDALTQLIHKPKQPTIAFVGGAKLSTKIPVLKELLSQYDEVCLGGAMATTIVAAQGVAVGESLVDKSAFVLAKTLAKTGNLTLPLDVMVTKRIAPNMKLRATEFQDIHPDELVVDIGPKTCVAWGKKIQAAQTILWNGPVGVVEHHASAEGSRFLARAIGLHAKGRAFGVAGGGDTIPLIVETQTLPWFDHVSTGGGALLEFVSTRGALPGLKPLLLN
jgi:phosphoglycerate kinase